MCFMISRIIFLIHFRFVTSCFLNAFSWRYACGHCESCHDMQHAIPHHVMHHSCIIRATFLISLLSRLCFDVLFLVRDCMRFSCSFVISAFRLFCVDCRFLWCMIRTSGLLVVCLALLVLHYFRVPMHWYGCCFSCPHRAIRMHVLLFWHSVIFLNTFDVSAFLRFSSCFHWVIAFFIASFFHMPLFWGSCHLFDILHPFRIRCFHHVFIRLQRIVSLFWILCHFLVGFFGVLLHCNPILFPLIIFWHF